MSPLFRPEDIEKEMDADLYGPGQKKFSLAAESERLSYRQMDSDLGLTPRRTAINLFPEPEPPKPEEPGYIGAAARGLYSGFRRRVPEMAGQALQFTEIAPEAGKAIAEWAREGEVKPDYENPVKQAIYEGLEMVAPSVAVPMAMGAAGVGGVPAAVATGAFFGLSQAQSTKEEAEKRGVEPGTAPLETGAIEALGETAGTYALTRLLGPLAPLFKVGAKTAIKDVIKPTLGRLLREFPKTLTIEASTEFGQQAGEAAVEKYRGIRPEAEPLAEGVGVLGPTAVLTAFTTALGIPAGRIRGRAIERVLTDTKVDPLQRQKVCSSNFRVLGITWSTTNILSLSGLGPMKTSM